MYEIKLVRSGKKMWINESIIHSIVQNKDGTYTLYHFNDKHLIIESFVKVK